MHAIRTIDQIMRKSAILSRPRRQSEEVEGASTFLSSSPKLTSTSHPSFLSISFPTAMAPKRRPLDPTTRPKNAKKSRQVVSYDSFEEALDAGVVQEEKGERYRVGDKVSFSPLLGEGFPL
ncbi:hypothetical protein BDY24DRAFT_279209 [Mrakia frigida]|uniref:uncharacterized protein n=1 Tax=Mrakia frigida TaxID=29902 RepID=UPI003FCBFDBA